MHWEKPFKKITIGLSNFLIIFFCSGFLYAQQIDFNSYKNSARENNSLAHIQSASGSAIVASGPFQITVNIDTAICETWPSQCSDTGHSAYAALANNHNPIRVNIQVLTTRGDPVNNLGSDTFSFSCPLVLPGQIALTRLDCSDCFVAGSDGMYAFFIHPEPSVTGHWYHGNYVMQVQVRSGKKKVARILAPFEIP